MQQKQMSMLEERVSHAAEANEHTRGEGEAFVKMSRSEGTLPLTLTLTPHPLPLPSPPSTFILTPHSPPPTLHIHLGGRAAAFSRGEAIEDQRAGG